MDVYHKVLTRLYEITGGKDSEDVDMAELLKREGFYPSIDDITTQMSRESWITETSQKNIVRITHWGVMEARKAGSSSPDAVAAVTKEANKLLSETREFIIVLEEFISKPSGDGFQRVEKKFSELDSMVGKIKEKT